MLHWSVGHRFSKTPEAGTKRIRLTPMIPSGLDAIAEREPNGITLA